MIQATGLSKSYGDRVLFEDLTWQISPGQRIALVGANGAGKTTLARVLSGRSSPDVGDVVMPRGWRIGYLEQEVDSHGAETVMERALASLSHLQVLAAEVVALQERVSIEPHNAGALAELGAKQGRLEQLGYYSAEARAKRILAGLGFGDADFYRPARELSGGWLMRIELAGLLLSEPDLLLLDEPTNHLDLETLVWFESYLRDWQGSIVVISHDRAFINRVSTHVAELRAGRLRLYTGNFDSYMQQAAEEKVLAEKRAAEQQRRLTEVQEFVDRFRSKASKATQVQSRVKALEKLDRVEVEAKGPQVASFHFAQPARTGKVVMELKGVAKHYGSTVVYRGIDFTLWRGDKLALVGPNGAGKSTLLKMLAGVVRPDEGERAVGTHVTIQYFAQHQLDQLDARRTVYDEMMAAADDDSAGRIRSLLGAFLFRGDDVHKTIGVLSGGEKSRVVLARMLLRPASLILMDEPTNHLDMASRDALEGALKQFEGTLVFISHDRHFINAVATAVVDVRGGKVERYDGNYDDYRRRADVERNPVSNPAGGATTGGRRDLRRQEAELRNACGRELRPLRARLAELESGIETAEAALLAMDEVEATDGFYTDGDAVRVHYARKSAMQADLEGLMAEWEGLGERIEARESDLERQLRALADD